MEKILVPVDGSEVCERAASHAKVLAEKFGSKVVLLNIIAFHSEPVYYGSPPKLVLEPGVADWKDVKTKARKESMDFLEKCKAQFEGLDVETVFVDETTDGFGNIIANYAKNENVDLIVMGSKGMGSLKQRITVGSVANKVLHVSEVPVMIIQ
jgi:nucleotide-binding universal stress UspA family protein